MPPVLVPGGVAAEVAAVVRAFEGDADVRFRFHLCPGLRRWIMTRGGSPVRQPRSQGREPVETRRERGGDGRYAGYSTSREALIRPQETDSTAVPPGWAGSSSPSRK